MLNRSARKFAFALTLLVLTAPVSMVFAQSTASSTKSASAPVVTGGDPEPQVVTGGDPEPQVVTGGDPEPQAQGIQMMLILLHMA